MSNKGRTTPRVVCCAIPIRNNKVLLVTSRKRRERWLLPKGGREEEDRDLESAAAREAWEEAGVHGKVTVKVAKIDTDQTTYHFYEFVVDSMDTEWPECEERDRAWFSYSEALAKLEWKEELRMALSQSSLALSSPPTSVGSSR